MFLNGVKKMFEVATRTNVSEGLSSETTSSYHTNEEWEMIEVDGGEARRDHQCRPDLG